MADPARQEKARLPGAATPARRGTAAAPPTSTTGAAREEGSSGRSDDAMPGVWSSSSSGAARPPRWWEAGWFAERLGRQAGRGLGVRGGGGVEWKRGGRAGGSGEPRRGDREGGGGRWWHWQGNGWTWFSVGPPPAIYGMESVDWRAGPPARLAGEAGGRACVRVGKDRDCEREADANPWIRIFDGQDPLQIHSETLNTTKPLSFPCKENFRLS